ncbi:hypothetical protein K437DRAFT_257649 [Tilletiaria anomala UBC 951]|uniref:Uncharacterized protein n=1 Tax=Tilletiaria anomala (strain ATCC 24038 / CBS 436.72 / UBC 951) TaxID=1037660 RepID=A0A066VML7_TILAU|nr:uncharacterized protein K437DRAFT_257649 [Tilletiaria anomala UBC 951]KDN42982.1 hypothetical protein K437DRAFT_257649 [Tilletiaria anomala UBC 951]
MRAPYLSWLLTANSIETSCLTSLIFVARYNGQPFGSASTHFAHTTHHKVVFQPGTPRNPGQATGQCNVKLTDTGQAYPQNSESGRESRPGGAAAG